MSLGCSYGQPSHTLIELAGPGLVRLGAAGLAGLVAVAVGLSNGRGAKTADGSGLARAGRFPEILMLKKRAADKTEYLRY